MDLYVWGDGNEGFLGNGVLGEGNKCEPNKVPGCWKSVGGGVNHILAIKDDNSLWAWGHSLCGKLGIGSGALLNARHCIPTQIPGTWLDVFRSYEQSFAIDSSCNTYTWGFNECGATGVGYVAACIVTPALLPGNWKCLSGGRDYSGGIKVDSSLWLWGDNRLYQLGMTTTGECSRTPIKMPGSWKALSLGYSHSLAIKTDGSLWAWGDNTNGKLGIGDVFSRSTPAQIPGTWIDIFAGETNSIGIKSDGSTWIWGKNTDGNFGTGNGNSSYTPVQIPGHWREISAAQSHTLGISCNGSLFSWGNGSRGKLGVEEYNMQCVSTPIMIVGEWDHVMAGRYYSAAIGMLPVPKTGHDLYAMGQTIYGKLGVHTSPEDTRCPYPTQVGHDSDWVDISVGNNHSLARKDDCSMWAWGRGSEWALGQGEDLDDKSTPVQIPGKWAGYMFGSAQWSVAKGITGDFYGWGHNCANEYWVVGGANGAAAKTPAIICGEWIKWASTGHYSMAICCLDNSLWGWGNNIEGILAQKSMTCFPGHWIDITASNDHLMGIKCDHSLWSWGCNFYGKVGNGTYVDVTTPTKIPGCWKHINANCRNSFGIQTDGTLWIWGQNVNGSMGEVGNKHNPFPLRIPGLWECVSVNRYSFIAKRVDGIYWGMGKNDVGQIGDECSCVSVSKLTYIPGNWSCIVGGHTHTLMIGDIDNVYSGKYCDKLYAWSGNTPPINFAPGLWKDVNSNPDACHSFLQDESGKYYAIGDNKMCQLGIGNSGPYVTTLVEIPGIWVDIKASMDAGVGLKRDGSLWTWGKDVCGQLGASIKTQYPYYVGTGFRSVSVGRRTVHAIDKNCGLWGWGDNGTNVPGFMGGMVGNGTRIPSHTPVPIPGKWECVISGECHTIAKKEDGSWWAWGVNQSKQINIECTGSWVSSPHIMRDSCDWDSIYTGDNHSFGKKHDETFWAWGSNTHGQLGLGYVGGCVDIPVKTPEEWSSVTIGKRVSYGLKGDGSIWVWGEFSNGIHCNPIRIPGYLLCISTNPDHSFGIGCIPPLVEDPKNPGYWILQEQAIKMKRGGWNKA